MTSPIQPETRWSTCATIMPPRSSTTDDPAYPSWSRVARIAVDPSTRRQIYAAFEGDGGTRLCFSKDYGRSWTRVKELRVKQFSERVILLHFERGLRMLTGSGIWVQRDGQWKQFPGPPGGVMKASSEGAGCSMRPTTAASTPATTGAKPGVRDWRPAGTPRFSAIACAAQHPESPTPPSPTCIWRTASIRNCQDYR